MGVPRFFSWITRRYPMILEDLEEYPLPEIDCLYLDMNGIIYKCSKDESIIFKAQVMSREIEEIWFNIFNYVNAIVDSINPRKLLFLGLDGVAPRAKMNNQRSRRFRSAKDYKELERKLQHYGDSKNEEEFKNNCITPGTEFMNELNRQLRFFIAKKIEEDPKWRKFNVIFSGADVPGEGEHKIMDFIRQCQKLQVYDDTTTHCLYGADADLIMLAMSLKVKKMCIIREEFTMRSKKVVISKARNLKTAKFQIIYVNILKEYFDLEYQTLKAEMKVPYDCQRILNDFVFLCFFIGNDFLPRCYCYDIRQGNLEVLIAGFKKFLKVCENYIIHDDHIDLKELERLTKILSDFESDFIGDRSDEARKAYKGMAEGQTAGESATDFEKELIEDISNKSQRLRTEREFLLELKTLYMNDSKEAKNKFYQIKLQFSPATQPEKLNQLLDSYIQGLHYVYQYYFGGLPSWEWYYPYYYAPLVADLHQYICFLNSRGDTLKPFNKSQPYEPFKQLMCILPQESVQLLPKCLQPLITQGDSPLKTPVNYFPDEVKIDPYGGLQEHQFINILPFIDQDKITDVYNSFPESNFTPEQLLRNRFSQNELYQADPNGSTFVKSFYTQISDFTAKMTVTPLDFKTEDVLKLKNIKPIGPVDIQAKLQFPSLYIRSFDSSMSMPNLREKTIEITLNEPESDKNFKLGEEVYFGYPYESHGRVMAIATEKDFRSIKQFRVLDFFYDEDFVQNDFKEPRDYWHEGRQKCKQRGLKLFGNKVYFLCQTELNYRKLNGEFARSYLLPSTLNLIIDATLISDSPKYAFTQRLYKPKSIKEQFLVGEEVVVLKHHTLAGSKGIVTGYDDQYNEIEVKITDATPPIPNQILRTINTLDFFFSIKFVANILQLNLQIVLDMLDSVQVFLDDSQMSAKGMPRTLDIGLNLIKRNERKLVPSLARLPNQGAKVDNLFKLFCDLEISVAAVNLLCDYKKAYPEIFTFMERRMSDLINDSKSNGRPINWRAEISSEKIYPKDKDPNEPIIRLYVWLLKKEEIHMPNAAINSKAVSKKKLSEVLNYFKTMRKVKPPTKDVAIDANYLYSQRLSEKGVVHLSKRPSPHAIADRVVCTHEAYFGERAVVVGIDNNQYEVLFERPSFGKNDLGGKVDYLWGGKFDFCELFNLDMWPDLIEPRYEKGSPNKTTLRDCWDGDAPEFIARFKNKAITSMKDYQTLGKEIDLPETGIEEYMNKRDREQFQVVIDKRNKHRQFYPRDDEKELIDSVIKPGADLKSIVNEFAMKKEASLKEALEEQKIEEKVEEKQPQAEEGSKPEIIDSKEIGKPKEVTQAKQTQPEVKSKKNEEKSNIMSGKAVETTTKPKNVIYKAKQEENPKPSKVEPQKRQFKRFVEKEEVETKQEARKQEGPAPIAPPTEAKKPQPPVQKSQKPKYVQKPQQQETVEPTPTQAEQVVKPEVNKAQQEATLSNPIVQTVEQKVQEPIKSPELNEEQLSKPEAVEVISEPPAQLQAKPETDGVSGEDNSEDPKVEVDEEIFG